MSATQSKGKKRHDKTSAYYGRRRAGYRCCSGSELTRDESVTLQRLQTFSSDDFEAYRARGEAFRRRLCGAVLHALPVSHAWRADCECRGEWGGVFPVHLRLTHQKNPHVTLDILSPGSESPFWHGLIWVNPDHTGLYVLNTEHFEPQAIGELLARVENMLADGFIPSEIVAVLGRRGGCA
ncbi:conjugation system SOS inhibitor PsiB family protein [Candidatus Pantoea soli]|nr:conjugation system SOS inhibitor PsiB family protein [Pantoea soli]